MPATRHSVEQIIAKLREVEKLTGQGMPDGRPYPDPLPQAAEGENQNLP
jgi:hypothetical protein